MLKTDSSYYNLQMMVCILRLKMYEHLQKITIH